MLTINFFLISMIYSLCLGTFTGNHPMYDEYILYIYIHSYGLYIPSNGFYLDMDSDWTNPRFPQKKLHAGKEASRAAAAPC
jgi:hypothetical protein